MMTAAKTVEKALRHLKPEVHELYATEENLDLENIEIQATNGCWQFRIGTLAWKFVADAISLRLQGPYRLAILASGKTEVIFQSSLKSRYEYELLSPSLRYLANGPLKAEGMSANEFVLTHIVSIAGSVASIVCATNPIVDEDVRVFERTRNKGSQSAANIKKLKTHLRSMRLENWCFKEIDLDAHLKKVIYGRVGTAPSNPYGNNLRDGLLLLVAHEQLRWVRTPLCHCTACTTSTEKNLDRRVTSTSRCPTTQQPAKLHPEKTNHGIVVGETECFQEVECPKCHHRMLKPANYLDDFLPDFECAIVFEEATGLAKRGKPILSRINAVIKHGPLRSKIMSTVRSEEFLPRIRTYKRTVDARCQAEGLLPTWPGYQHSAGCSHPDCGFKMRFDSDEAFVHRRTFELQASGVYDSAVVESDELRKAQTFKAILGYSDE